MVMAWSSWRIMLFSALRPSSVVGQYEERRSPPTLRGKTSKPRRRHSLGAGTENEARQSGWPTGERSRLAHSPAYARRPPRALKISLPTRLPVAALRLSRGQNIPADVLIELVIAVVNARVSSSTTKRGVVATTLWITAREEWVLAARGNPVPLATSPFFLDHRNVPDT